MASVSGNMHRSNAMSGVWHVPRSRGVISGILLVLLGIWGGLVPFWGPQFGYAYYPATTWTFTWPRLFLEILPALAVILGGLGLLLAAHRVGGMVLGWLAAIGGAWFVIGPSLAVLWGTGIGSPAATTTVGRTVAEIGFFYGLGAAVLFLSAMALGRFSVLGFNEVRSAERGRAARGTAGSADTAAVPAPGVTRRHDPQLDNPRMTSHGPGTRGETTRTDLPPVDGPRRDDEG